MKTAIKGPQLHARVPLVRTRVTLGPQTVHAAVLKVASINGEQPRRGNRPGNQPESFHILIFLYPHVKQTCADFRESGQRTFTWFGICAPVFIRLSEPSVGADAPMHSSTPGSGEWNQTGHGILGAEFLSHDPSVAGTRRPFLYRCSKAAPNVMDSPSRFTSGRGFLSPGASFKHL